ncbi:MAG: hypothetical protein ABIO44_05990 [Saprospiraceae bacterium]
MKYQLNDFNINFSPNQVLELAKNEYSKRYPQETKKFSHCIIYNVIAIDKSISLKFVYPQEKGLQVEFIHKRPTGAKIGETITNLDIREITNIKIPLYENYCFDFIFIILDNTTDSYWLTNLWTKKVCPNLKYYQTKERKEQYISLGKQIAKKYNTTNHLGHVNLKSLKLKQSIGIKRLINNGWLPSISIFPQPYSEMIRIIEKDNEIEKVNLFVNETFRTNKILESMLDRWNYSSLAKKRIKILETCIERFLNKDYISSIYLLLPQIEGLITSYIISKGKTPEEYLSKRFTQFKEEVINEIYNTDMTKYLTRIFVKNLHKTFYKTWYPFERRGRKYIGSPITPQRNTILHGNIKIKYFSEENCLKLFCIIDNIILLSLTKRELKKPK